MKLIGDVHGKFDQYKKLLKQHTDTIQLGDMGVGFRKWPHGEWQANPPYDLMVERNAWFIRGNHDNPWVCRNHSRCVSDGHVMVTQKGTKVMLVGGAYSIDRAWRIEGYSWWPDEELSQKQMYAIAEIYETEKPDVVLSHDAPIVHGEMLVNSHHRELTRTSQFLQSLWNAHKPKLWVHGHYHVSAENEYQGTTFVCLAELELREFDI